MIPGRYTQCIIKHASQRTSVRRSGTFLSSQPLRETVRLSPRAIGGDHGSDIRVHLSQRATRPLRPRAMRVASGHVGSQTRYSAAHLSALAIPPPHRRTCYGHPRRHAELVVDSPLTIRPFPQGAHSPSGFQRARLRPLLAPSKAPWLGLPWLGSLPSGEPARETLTEDWADAVVAPRRETRRIGPADAGALAAERPSSIADRSSRSALEGNGSMVS